MKKLITQLFIAASIFILAVMACFLLTPLWWKLESILGLELAGHSGPADWLLFSFGGFFAALSLILMLYFQHSRKFKK